MAGAGWARLQAPGRVQGVDLARGLAIIGMFAAHLFTLPEWSWSDPGSWGAIAAGRSSILFVTLAGVSIGLLSGGTVPLVGRGLGLARRRLAVRAAIIWAIGLVLIATGVPAYIVLPAYALLFLVALPLLRLPAAPLLGVAAALAVVTPFLFALVDALPFWGSSAGELVAVLIGWRYPVVVWCVFLIAGLGIGRLDLTRVGIQGALLGVGAALAVLGYGLAAGGPREGVWSAAPHSSGLFETIGSGGFAVAVLGGSLLLCRTVVSGVVVPLRAVGSMPLTAYVAQLLVWAGWAALALGDVRDLAGFRELAPFWPITLGIVAGATAWALTLGRGPLERLVDVTVRAAVRDDAPPAPR